MEEVLLKQTVADTGRLLLKKGLVARTWGNISCRIDESNFAITPSGLGYEDLTAHDIPVFNMETEKWTGNRKPSSEKKIHGACYKAFPDVNFVIHTHQDYATAIGLAGAGDLEMTEEEKALLGEIRTASYGLPGTKTLKKAVEKELGKGSKVILMIHHGAVIAGESREDAVHKAEVLETVCQRAFEKKVKTAVNEKADMKNLASFSAASLESVLSQKFNNLKVIENNLFLTLAEKGTFKAQTDDMAQMIGGKLYAVKNAQDKIEKVLEKQDAVLVKGIGCVIKGEDADDVSALEMLLKKAAMAKLYTLACNKQISLGSFDCALMHLVYTKKYSKKKNLKKE